MLNDRIGVCLVGGGSWARNIQMPAFREVPGVDVVCVVAATAASAARLASEYGVKAWSTNYEEAVAASDVDVVNILAPNYLHASVAIAAARARKHVICIKPMATSVADARKMLQAAKEARVRLLYAENVPFIPAIREARRLIAAGMIGEIFRMKASEGVPGPHAPWTLDPIKCGGGALIEMGVHSISFCRTIAGSPIASIFAELGTFRWADRLQTEDTAVLVLRFDNGAIGHCDDSWSLAGAADSRFEIFGTDGRILIDNLHRQPVQMIHTGSAGAQSAGWSSHAALQGSCAGWACQHVPALH